VPSLMSEIIADNEAEYAAHAENKKIYLPKGRPPQPGDVLVQSDLARTIQYMIDEEGAGAKGGRVAGLQAARNAFYRGDIAQAIAKHQRENGGFLTEEDLRDFRVDVEPALRVSWNGAEVYTCGPWCQGPVLGQALAMLDGTDLKSLGHNSPAYIHHLVEVLKLAFADRHRYYGDPKFVDVPIRELLSEAYAAERRRQVDPHRASPDMPAPGSVAGRSAGKSPDEAPGPLTSADVLDTSYVCAVDRHGNAFSATPSDGSYGAPIVPGLGFVPSTRGVQSWTDPSVPAVLAPGKRPRLTPSPALLRKPGEWIMPIGSPGNDVQPQAILQVLLNIHLFGMSPQQAVEQPRFATFSFPRSSEPHSYSPGMLKLEGRMPQSTFDALKGLGHDVSGWPDWEWVAGAVSTILADTRTKTMEGGSDPRRPTAVAGW
jgi:gamma-glutamyltranspeptidase / glutathione hydrolase